MWIEKKCCLIFMKYSVAFVDNIWVAIIVRILTSLNHALIDDAVKEARLSLKLSDVLLLTSLRLLRKLVKQVFRGQLFFKEVFLFETIIIFWYSVD